MERPTQVSAIGVWFHLVRKRKINEKRPGLAHLKKATNWWKQRATFLKVASGIFFQLQHILNDQIVSNGIDSESIELNQTLIVILLAFKKISPTYLYGKFFDWIIDFLNWLFDEIFLVGGDFNMDMKSYDLKRFADFLLVPYRPVSGNLAKDLKNSFVFTFDSLQVRQKESNEMCFCIFYSSQKNLLFWSSLRKAIMLSSDHFIWVLNSSKGLRQLVRCSTGPEKWQPVFHFGLVVLPS